MSESSSEPAPAAAPSSWRKAARSVLGMYCGGLLLAALLGLGVGIFFPDSVGNVTGFVTTTPLNEIYIPLEKDPGVDDPEDVDAQIDVAVRRIVARVTYRRSMRRYLLFNLMPVLLVIIFLPSLVYLFCRRDMKKESAGRGVCFGFLLLPVLTEVAVVGKTMFVITARRATGWELPDYFWAYASCELGAMALLLFIPALYYYEHAERAAVDKVPHLSPGYLSYVWRRRGVLFIGVSLIVLAAAIESRFVL